MKANDNEQQRVVQQVTTNNNEWQRLAISDTSGNEWQRVTASNNEWQRVTTSGTTSDNKWQRVTTNDNDWQRVAKVVQRVKKTHLLQKMDDCNSFYNENRHTTSRDGWLILEWLNRLPLTSSKKVAGLNK